MADQKNKDVNKKDANAVADAHNWEQRVKGEIDAPRKWTESWGPYFR